MTRKEELQQKSRLHYVKAKKYLRTAHEILTSTMEIVDDPKLFIPTVENIFLCCSNSLYALLLWERASKEIPPFSANFSSKYHVFENQVAQKYHFDENTFEFMQELHQIIKLHRQTAVEFVRNGQVIICDNEYALFQLSEQSVKDHFSQAALFLQKVEEILHNGNV